MLFDVFFPNTKIHLLDLGKTLPLYIQTVRDITVGYCRFEKITIMKIRNPNLSKLNEYT